MWTLPSTVGSQLSIGNRVNRCLSDLTARRGDQPARDGHPRPHLQQLMQACTYSVQKMHETHSECSISHRFGVSFMTQVYHTEQIFEPVFKNASPVMRNVQFVEGLVDGSGKSGASVERSQSSLAYTSSVKMGDSVCGH